MLKMTISTSIWSAQHPNAGQNIQHIEMGPGSTQINSAAMDDPVNLLKAKSEIISVYRGIMSIY